jgi:hypothetical protein
METTTLSPTDSPGKTIANNDIQLSLDINERAQKASGFSREEIIGHMDELRRWQAVTLGREGRVGELKREVNALAARLGLQPPYGSTEDIARKENR